MGEVHGYESMVVRAWDRFEVSRAQGRRHELAAPREGKVAVLEGRLGTESATTFGDGRDPVARRTDRLERKVHPAIAHVKDAPGRQLSCGRVATLEARCQVSGRDPFHLLGHVPRPWEVGRDRGGVNRRESDGDADGVDVVGALMTVVALDRDETLTSARSSLRRTRSVPEASVPKARRIWSTSPGRAAELVERPNEPTYLLPRQRGSACGCLRGLPRRGAPST